MNAPEHDPQLHRLNRLREQRGWTPRDNSLAFVAKVFEREVARPFKQLEGIAAAWETLVPAELQPGCKLEALQRGVLTVATDSSATLYQLDVFVRDGLAVKLAQACKGKAIRRIRLRVDTTLQRPADPPEDQA